MFIKKLMPFFNADGGQGSGSVDASAISSNAINGTSIGGGTITSGTISANTLKADAINTDQLKADPMIPKSRFDEVNGKYKELADKVAAFEQAEAQRQAEAQEAARKQAEEQGKFEELYNGLQKELETYKTYESRSKELEGLIDGMVKTKLESVPEDLHDIIPNNLTPEQTLDWLNKAESKGIFGAKASEPIEVGKPSNHSNEAPKIDNANLSPLDKILAGLGK